MSMTFALKGHKGKLYHGSHSRTPLEFRGTWNMTGRQPVGDGGVPQWIDELMEANPDIQQIAISTNDGGVIWSRIPEEATL
jgi:hypothetical protein